MNTASGGDGVSFRCRKILFSKPLEAVEERVISKVEAGLRIGAPRLRVHDVGGHWGHGCGNVWDSAARDSPARRSWHRWNLDAWILRSIYNLLDTGFLVRFLSHGRLRDVKLFLSNHVDSQLLWAYWRERSAIGTRKKTKRCYSSNSLLCDFSRFFKC